MNWPWSSSPDPEEVDAAVKSAAASMATKPIDFLNHLELGSNVCGILTYLGGGTFLDLSEVCYVSLNPCSEPYIMFRNGSKVALTEHGATLLAKLIESRTKS